MVDAKITISHKSRRKHQLKEFDSQNCCKLGHCLSFSGHNQDKNVLNLWLQRENTTILMPLNVQIGKSNIIWMGFPKGTEFYISKANLALANLTLLFVSAMLRIKVCPRLLSTVIYVHDPIAPFPRRQN